MHLEKQKQMDILSKNSSAGLSVLQTSWLNSLSSFKSTEIHSQLPQGSAQDRALINSNAASHRKKLGRTRDPLQSLELNLISHINEDCD